MSPVTRAELSSRVRWSDIGLGELSLFVPLFGEELPFVLFPGPGAAPEVTDRMAAIVSDLLALPPGELARVKELLWEECNFAFQVTDYGVTPEPGETPQQAALREFGLSDPDEALRQSDVKEIHVVDEFIGRYAEIKVSTGSESYISLIVKDGRIIDFDDNGAYLGEFDEVEQCAHEKRRRLLGG